MKINFNLSAVIANNSLGKSENKLQSSLAKLSSGYRINEAKDDSTGMAISRKMKEQISALGKCNTNALDGVSLLQTAEGALSEIQSMLQRLRELGVQAANGTNSTGDKEAIQAEVNQLVEEIDRLSKDTEFNGMSLLNGSLQEKGFTSQPDNVSVDYFTNAVMANNYSFTFDAAATPPDHLASKASAKTGTAVSIGGTITAAMAGKVTINGYEVSIEEGDTPSEVFEKLRQGANYADVNLYAVDPAVPAAALDKSNLDSVGYSTTPFTDGSTALLFVSEDYGSDAHVSISCDNTALAAALSLDQIPGYGTPTADSVTTVGTDTKITLGTGFSTTATYRSDGDKVTITDINGFEVDLSVSPLTTMTQIDLEITDMGDLTVQVGGHDGQIISVSLPDCGSEALGINNLNMVGSESINKSMLAIDKALDRITQVRASVGAYENRLDATIRSIGETSENMTAAYSRVMDTDMASEMTEYTQQNVITQAATSMLAQANDLPQTVLQLLSK